MNKFSKFNHKKFTKNKNNNNRSNNLSKKISFCKNTIKNSNNKSTIIDYNFDISFLHNYHPTKHKKIDTIIRNILEEKIDTNNIKYFLSKIKYNKPIDSATKAVPDIMALPMKIGDESKPIEIYRNYKKKKIYALDIINCIIIKLRLGLLYNNISKILIDGNINDYNKEIYYT